MILDHDVNKIQSQDMYDVQLLQQPLLIQALCTREASIIIAALVLLGIVFKRQLQELTSLSYFFLAAVAGLITLCAFELAKQKQRPDEHLSIDQYMDPKPSVNMVTSINIVCFAYSFQFQVFPAFVELEKRSNFRFQISSALALTVCGIAYMSMGLICVSMFGEEIKSDVLLNFGDRAGVISISIRMIFSVLLLIHIPFIFMPTKEFALVLHDEIARRSISDHLEKKLQLHREREEEQRRQQQAERDNQDSDQEELIKEEDKEQKEGRQDQESGVP